MDREFDPLTADPATVFSNVKRKRRRVRGEVVDTKAAKRERQKEARAKRTAKLARRKQFPPEAQAVMAAREAEAAAEVQAELERVKQQEQAP